MYYELKLSFLCSKRDSLLRKYLNVVVPGVVCHIQLNIICIVNGSCSLWPSAL